MALDRLGEQRQASRARVVAGAVVLAYVAFAVFAQLIGEDETDRAEATRLNGFCTALYSDYAGLLSTLAYEGDVIGPFADTAGGRQLYGEFINADLAPEEFRDEVDHLAEGLDRAVNGELAPAEVDAYIRAYEELQEAARPTCDAVGQEIQAEDFGPQDAG
jgi:hypothetical protein